MTVNAEAPEDGRDIMMTKADFTPDEWKTLAPSAVIVGIVVNAADAEPPRRRAGKKAWRAPTRSFD